VSNVIDMTNSLLELINARLKLLVPAFEIGIPGEANDFVVGRFLLEIEAIRELLALMRVFSEDMAELHWLPRMLRSRSEQPRALEVISQWAKVDSDLLSLNTTVISDTFSSQLTKSIESLETKVSSLGEKSVRRLRLHCRQSGT
jgi:hypothetical protein